MCSNRHAFPPKPAALLGAADGTRDQEHPLPTVRPFGAASGRSSARKPTACKRASSPPSAAARRKGRRQASAASSAWRFALRAVRPGRPINGAPVWRRAGAEKGPQGRAQGRARVRPAQEALSANPRSPSAHLEGRMPGRRLTGVPFLLVTSLYGGLPARRPAGRLRRSAALLRGSWARKEK